MPNTRSAPYFQWVERDRHIPVYWGGAITAGDAVLAEIGHDAPDSAYVMRFDISSFGHRPGCGCCGARNPIAQTLAALFRARATGRAPFFKRVVVLASDAGWAEIKAVLAQDALARARFKPASDWS